MKVLTFYNILLAFEFFLFGFLIGHALGYFIYTSKK